VSTAERLLLQAVAIALALGVLVAVASTPAYPIALGVEVIALFWVVAGNTGVITAATKFVGSNI
jgi:ABC-type sugar transport system substrate-binding protein